MLIMGLPVMLDPAANADANAKNKLFAAAVAEVGFAARALRRALDARSRGEDEYKPFLPNANNAMVQVRAPDGMHFTTFGYDLVMDAFYPAILESLKQRGRDLVGECRSTGSEVRRLRNSTALLAWAAALMIGAVGATLTAKVDVSAPASDPAVESALLTASQLALPASPQIAKLVSADARFAAWRPSDPTLAPKVSARVAASPSAGDKLLRAAMLARPAMSNLDPTPLGAPRNVGALSALESALPPAERLSPQLTAYGELQPDSFTARRLTILQLGDSHTAADFFSGRVRERLQQVFGTGGRPISCPAGRILGVRSALFDSDASDGWTYEALQKSDDQAPLLSLRLQRRGAPRRRRAEPERARRPRL